jgi:dienelactone hydrolase
MISSRFLRGLFSWPQPSFFLLWVFLTNTIGPLPQAQADEFFLPAPGMRIELSLPYNPPILKGLKVHPDNPFRFDFILDEGDGHNHQEAIKLIKYFLASLTVPEKDLWVNLSPYERNRIVPESFGRTEMGRDLLAEDYMLKQITASLIYPEEETGKKFWKQVYEEAARKFGTTNIPVNTFNKVWIVPEKAVVYENTKSGTAYVVESKLKVMLEQDYLAQEKHAAVSHGMASVGANVVREIVIPELTKEINQGKNFAQLRQVYNSLILATWYKRKIKDSILAQVYEDKNKVAGILSSPNAFVGDPEHIYQRYLQAFKKGVYNYIKEEQDPFTQETIPRKYFSGGMDLAMNVTHLGSGELQTVATIDPSKLNQSNLEIVSSRFDAAMNVPLDSLLARSTGLDLSKKIRFFVQVDSEPLIINRHSQHVIQEMGYHERILTPDEVLRLIDDVGLESMLSKIKWLKKGRSFKAVFDRVIGQLRTAPVEAQPFAIKEVSFLSPIIKPSFLNTGTVYTRYFQPKGSEGKRLPAVVVCSFLGQDYFARLVSIYLASQGVAVLEVGLPLYDKRSVPGTEGMNTVQRYVKLDFDPQKFKDFILQSIADTSAAVRWLGSQKEIDASRISLSGQSMTGAVAISTYVIDPDVKNIFALVPVVNYAHLLWSKGKRYAPIRELLEHKGITEQDFNADMEGFNVDELASAVNTKNNDTVIIGAVRNDELVRWSDIQSLISSLDQPKNVFSAYGIPGLSAHLFGSMRVGITSGFFEKMRSTITRGMDSAQVVPVDQAMAVSNHSKKTYSIDRGILTGSIYDKEFIKDERKRASEKPTIVFDMDGTVLEFGYLRPGIVEQLRQLKRMGYRLVLWSTASTAVIERLLLDYPEIHPLFDLFITSSNGLDALMPFKTAGYQNRYFLKLFQEFGEKIPQDWEEKKPIHLFGYKLLVDDLRYPGISFRSYMITTSGPRFDSEPNTELAHRIDVMVKSPEIRVSSNATWGKDYGKDSAMNVNPKVLVRRVINGFVPFSYSHSEAVKYFELLMKRPYLTSREGRGLIRMSSDGSHLLILFSAYGKGAHKNLVKRAWLNGYSRFEPEKEWASFVFRWDSGARNLYSITLVPPLMKRPREQYSKRMLSFLGLERDKVAEMETDAQYRRDMHDELILIARLIREAAFKKGIDPNFVEVTVANRYLIELKSVDTNLRELANFPTYQEIKQRASVHVDQAMGSDVHGPVKRQDPVMMVPYIFDRTHVIKYFEDLLFKGPSGKNSISILRMNIVQGRLLITSASENLSHSELIKSVSELEGYSKDHINREWFSMTDKGSAGGLSLIFPLMSQPRKQISSKMLQFLGQSEDEVPDSYRDEKYIQGLKNEFIEIVRVIKAAALRKGVDPKTIKLQHNGDFKKQLNGQESTLDNIANLKTSSDEAMKVPENGGIDLTSTNIGVNAGGGIRFHIDPAMLAKWENAPGVVPMIISVEPMTDLGKFLGAV